MVVDNLKKIVLQIESGASPDEMDLLSPPVMWEFIFGTGSEGITPFEYELANKTVGDEILIPVHPAEISARFEHLDYFIRRNIPSNKSFYLKVRIVQISVPENREVVRALAEGTSHGSGCDCGCGCDSH